MRVRGLKLIEGHYTCCVETSHPMRVRGLKQAELKTRADEGQVAPHAGAWIET